MCVRQDTLFHSPPFPLPSIPPTPHPIPPNYPDIPEGPEFPPTANPDPVIWTDPDFPSVPFPFPEAWRHMPAAKMCPAEIPYRFDFAVCAIQYVKPCSSVKVMHNMWYKLPSLDRTVSEESRLPEKPWVWIRKFRTLYGMPIVDAEPEGDLPGDAPYLAHMKREYNSRDTEEID
eukprot:GDKI01030188.1.p1 GENE.GDKI01030188.1~~GDKI01030188.1.p1  ORF type:complete len:181 (-),score=28.44 GDKI01030188.1:327-848(-)